MEPAALARARVRHLSFLRGVVQQLEQGEPRAACLLRGAVHDGRWRCFGCNSHNTVWQTAGSAPATRCHACDAPHWTCLPHEDALELLAHGLRVAIRAVSGCIYRADASAGEERLPSDN